MANKQIHELPAVAEINPSDRVVLSTANDNLTRQGRVSDIQFPIGLPNSINRPIGEKFAEQVSVLDFGAKGDGTEDDTQAINNALASGAGSIFLPAGIYRTTEPLQLGGRVKLVGEGGFNTKLRGDHDGDILVVSDGETVNSLVADVGFEMSASASSALRVVGHRVILDRLWFEGGSANGWAIDMVDSNECVISHIIAGLPGNPPLSANGIRWRNSSPTSNSVNYGDALIVQPIIRLGSSDTTGILLDGGGSGNVINNVNIDRIQVTASQSGESPLPGTIGLHLKNASRNRIFGGGFEAIDTGVFEEGSGSSGGLECKGNGFFGVYTVNATNPYRDSTSEIGGSVKDRTFIGCDNLQAGAMSRYDTSAPRGIWLNSWVGSSPAVCLRSFNGPLLMTPESSEYNTDGVLETPTKGLRFDVGSSTSATISRTIGQNSNISAALNLGNDDSHPDGPLRYVRVQNPLYLQPRETPAVAPVDGMLVHAATPSGLPGGVQWHGPGYYVRQGFTNSNGASVDYWHPAAVAQGRQPERERNLDFVVEKDSLGTLQRVNNGNDRTVIIPSNIIEEGEAAGWFDVLRQGDGHVYFEMENRGDVTGTMRTPSDRRFIPKRWQTVRVVIRRTGATSSDVYIDGIYQDADEPGTIGDKEKNVDFVLSPQDRGQLLRVNNASDRTCTIPNSLIPEGYSAIEAKISKQGDGDVVFAAGDNVNLRLPGGVDRITEKYRTVTVIVRRTGYADAPTNQIPLCEAFFEGL